MREEIILLIDIFVYKIKIEMEDRYNIERNRFVK